LIIEKKEYKKYSRLVLGEKLISNRTIIKEFQEIGVRKQTCGSHPIKYGSEQ
jgi:hypothetical protein